MADSNIKRLDRENQEHFLVYILIAIISASTSGARLGSLHEKIMRELLFFIQSILSLVSAISFPLFIQSDTCDQVLLFLFSIRMNRGNKHLR